MFYLNKLHFSFLIPVNKNIQGFTLIEILLSISLIAALAGVSTPIYRLLQVRNDLDITINSLAQTLRRAQILSSAVDGDTTWGVNIQNGSLTLFKGSSFTSRDSTYDETFNISSSISVSGLQEVVYAKFAGLPQSIGTTTLTTSSDSRSITINTKGTLSF